MKSIIYINHRYLRGYNIEVVDHYINPYFTGRYYYKKYPLLKVLLYIEENK